jgi:hypothetical protein
MYQNEKNSLLITEKGFFLCFVGIKKVMEINNYFPTAYFLIIFTNLQEVLLTLFSIELQCCVQK